MYWFCIHTIFITWLIILINGEIIRVKDDLNVGKTFEGIGAISGGGATSKLLPQYADDVQKAILKYLFQPGYGASLHILKVEIGGDSQSTEGTEASHMHWEDDLNCNRGYEGWLMIKAKEINPNIKIAALPWAFPGWVGTRNNPYAYPNKTTKYVIEWIKCAKNVFNISVDYLGIWNERDYSIEYIKTLRIGLDMEGFNQVKIVASDNEWDIAQDMLKDSELNSSVYAIGAHYPATKSSQASLETKKSLWASEDYSTYNDDVGSGCWARILNQNYVNGYITSTIAWNLVSAFFPGLPYEDCALMTAPEPWSGHYEVPGPVWVTAHTTQFVQPGWHYLKHGNGVGLLQTGGSIVTLISPDRKDVTIILETMSHDHSMCIRPPLPNFNVTAASIDIVFDKNFLPHVDELYVYVTKLYVDSQEGLQYTEKVKNSQYFKYIGKVKLVNLTVTLNVKPDELYTFSTLMGNHGVADAPVAPSQPFPLPYLDNFDAIGLAGLSEPNYLSAQVGYYELVAWESVQHLCKTGVCPQTTKARNLILQQMVLEQPIDWCSGWTRPVTVMGDVYTWFNVHVSATLLVPTHNSTDSVFIAARVDKSGCAIGYAKGVFFWINFTAQKYYISLDYEHSTILKFDEISARHDEWIKLEIILRGKSGMFYFNDRLLAKVDNLNEKPGLVGLGSGNFGHSLVSEFFINRS